jgi:hypothetical protein
MRNFYLRNPHGFDRWLKANAILGSLLAIGMLAIAVAGLNLGVRFPSMDSGSPQGQGQNSKTEIGLKLNAK